MCLYPKTIQNRKYRPSKKNLILVTDIESHKIPECKDERCLNIQVPCGMCMECRKQKASEWRVRMAEEIKEHKYNYFITLTFDNKSINELCREFNCWEEPNRLAGHAIRRFLERFRKQYGKSLKHWLIVELGHQGTERTHLHGILFSDHELTFQETEDKQYKKWSLWKYGIIWVGEYCNQRTINYIVKYITKLDTDHKGFQGQIFCSPGIGAKWVERQKLYGTTYRYIKGGSRTDFRLNTGNAVKLPTYYKNKLYTEEERELIWRDFMDKEIQTVRGENHSTERPIELGNIIKKAQEVNLELGFGDDSPQWKKRKINVTNRQKKALLDKELEKKVRKICMNQKGRKID